MGSLFVDDIIAVGGKVVGEPTTKTAYGYQDNEVDDCGDEDTTDYLPENRETVHTTNEGEGNEDNQFDNAGADVGADGAGVVAHCVVITAADFMVKEGDILEEIVGVTTN